MTILGGRQAMIDSPLIREIVTEQVAATMHRVIVDLLADRLGTVPPEVEAAVRTIQDDERLNRASRLAARAADFESFHRDLAALPVPPPPAESRPRRRRG
jgi:hypothetical protein